LYCVASFIGYIFDMLDRNIFWFLAIVFLLNQFIAIFALMFSYKIGEILNMIHEKYAM